MGATTTQIVHFSITGEAVTDIARDALLSERPGSAYRIIAEGLHGVGSHDLAVMVLRGTHDIVGERELKAVPAKDTPRLRKYLKDAAFIYAGRYRDSRGWRRPRAIVVGFNAKDARYASDKEPISIEGIPNDKWLRRRSEYYCSEGERVHRVKHPDSPEHSRGVFIIWEPCTELPHWMASPLTLEDALKQFLDVGRRLDKLEAVEGELDPDIDDRFYTDQYFDEDEKEAFREEREARRQAKEEEEERKYQERLEGIRTKVMEKAGDDTFILTLQDGKEVTVPRAPFMRWALCRTDYFDQAPQWENESWSGMRLPLDNPDHSDWMLGAGLELADYNRDNVSMPALEEMFEIQESFRRPKVPFAGIMAAMEMLSETVHACTVIADSGEVEGIVGKDIAVFPDSKPKRVKQLEGIKGVIVEKGGQLGHFAIVSRGKGVTVMLHKQACDLFEEGVRLNLNPKTGRVVILEGEE